MDQKQTQNEWVHMSFLRYSVKELMLPVTRIKCEYMWINGHSRTRNMMGVHSCLPLVERILWKIPMQDQFPYAAIQSFAFSQDPSLSVPEHFFSFYLPETSNK